MKFTRRIRQVAESLLACLGLSVLPFLPRNWIVRLSRRLGNTAFRLCRNLRKRATANLDIAFGSSLSFEEKQAIARESFETFSLTVLDLFWFGMFSRKRIETYVKFDPSFNFYFNTAPAVVVTGHLGNWEVLGQAVALHGDPCVSVAAPLENPFVDWMLNRFRRATGQEIVEKKGAMKTLIKALREGGRTALLMDQNTLPSDGGEFVDFFGLSVPISKAVSALIRRTGADIVFIFCVADNDGRYTAYALPPFSAKGAEVSDDEITQAVAEMLECEIRKHPGQWLWMYKRWKHVPPGASPEGYPFYARGTSGRETVSPETR